MNGNKPLSEHIYLVFDTETASYKGMPKDDRMIEIGWVVIKGAKFVKRQSYVIHHEHPENLYIRPKIQVTHQEISEGIPVTDAIKELLEDMQSCDIIVGHNIGYDMRILHNEMARIEELQGALPSERLIMIDTLTLSRKLFPEAPSHKLKDVIQILGIPETDQRHKAINDVMYTALCMGNMFRKLRLENGIITFDELQKFLKGGENIEKLDS